MGSGCIPFALQWILPIPLAIGIYLAPESPWWLIRKGRTEDAGKVVRRLRAKDSNEDEIADTVAGPGEVDAELARLFAALAS